MVGSGTARGRPPHRCTRVPILAKVDVRVMVGGSTLRLERTFGGWAGLLNVAVHPCRIRVLNIGQPRRRLGSAKIIAVMLLCRERRI